MVARTTFESVRQRLLPVFEGSGLFVRGAFHPVAEDKVPALPDGSPARTALLVGNAGADLWHAFLDENPDLSVPHPLDRWVDSRIEAAAAAVGAHALYPTRRPWPPVQRWAKKADSVYPSPLGLQIHPEFGLWHVYRGVLCFAERLALPRRPAAAPSPCDSCEKKPCLSVCPADAFKPDAFDMVGCVDHVEGEDTGKCARFGCLARRACPVGRSYRYPADEGAYHMAAVIATVRDFQRRGDV